MSLELPSSPESEEQLTESHEEKARSRWQETVASHRKWAELGLAAGCMLLAPRALHGQERESREMSESRREALQALQEADPSGERLNYIESRFPLHVRLEMVHEARKAEERESVNPPQFVNFERFGISDELIREFFSEKYFPKGMIIGQIDAVVVHDTLAFLERERKKIDESGREIVEVDSLKIYANAPAIRDIINIFPHESLGKVRTSQGEKMLFATALAYILTHEWAHQSDPMSDNRLSLDKRLDFSIELAKMYERPGSFRDRWGYADSFKDPDPRIQFERRSEEWWATLVEEWRMRPEELKKHHPEDFAFAHKWMTRYDPDFDPVVALEAHEVLYTAIDEAYERRQQENSDS